MFALCLLAGGLADEYLRPDHWGTLAAGIGRGLEALPGINVPYQGQDEWTRLCLAAGGTALVAGATALALWPRRDGRLGYPLPALVLLVALAVVPAVVLAFEGEFILGAVLSLLVLGFLRLEKLRRRDAARRRGPRVGGRLRGARARARPGRPPAVVGLRELGAVRLHHAHHVVRVGPRLLAARVAARRPRAPARPGAPARVLEGPGPRRLRRRRVAGGAPGAARARAGAAPRPGRGRALEPGHPGDDPQPPHADLRRGRRGVRRERPAREHGGVPVRHGRVRGHAGAHARRLVSRVGLHAAAHGPPAAAGGHRRGHVARGLPAPLRQHGRAGGREPAAGHGDRLPELDRGRRAADGPPGAPGRR